MIGDLEDRHQQLLRAIAGAASRKDLEWLERDAWDFAGGVDRLLDELSAAIADRWAYLLEAEQN
jgi:hypothetical protein